MSSRPIFSPAPVITDGDMSGDIISKVTIIQNLSMISYDISWVGSAPVGVMSVEVSNSYRQNASGAVADPGDWQPLPLSVVPTVSGSPGNGFIDVLASSAYAIRLRYTFTSGTGTMQAIVSGKVE